MIATTDNAAKQVLTNDEAAAYLGIAPNTLEQWRSAGKYDIPFVKIGNRIVRYRQADLARWVEERVVGAAR